MSVVFTCKDAVVIDHKAWIADTYNHQQPDLDFKEEFTLSNLWHLFDLQTPYLMDSQAEKIAKQMEGGLECEEPPRKKKKTKDVTLDEDSEAFHELAHVLEVFTALRMKPEFKKIFSYKPSPDNFRENNKLMRNIRKRFAELNCKLPTPLQGQTNQVHEVLILEEDKYILPPHVEYICDDVKNIVHHTASCTYDLIVIDPPWWNKHVRRQNSSHGSHYGYSMMTVSDIVRIPLGKMLSEGGLLVIWCTNNRTQIDELQENLHRWDGNLVATWYWLKLTRGGEPVTSLDAPSHGKRPYERILLVRKKCKISAYPAIPDGLLVCSIPSGLHSHKPPLIELIKDYIPSDARCLEIFARSLIPGWTSYGLEVLKLQHAFLFEDLHFATV